MAKQGQSGWRVINIDEKGISESTNITANLNKLHVKGLSEGKCLSKMI